MKKRSFFFLAAGVVLWHCIIWSLLVGCAGIKQAEDPWVTTAYRALGVSATAYDTIMMAAQDASSAGLLSVNDRIRIRNAGIEFWGAWHMARNSLEVYGEFKAAQSRQEYQAAFDTLTGCLEQLQIYIEPFMGSVEGEETNG